MTQGHYNPQHRRTLSGSNAPKPRTARPGLLRKGTSFVNHSISKLGSRYVRRCELDDDCQPEMAASFLNFCAMCERQITVPDNSRLYCSESCRRKDTYKPLLASLPSNRSIPSSTTPPTSPPISPRVIVAPMTPTKAPAMSTPAIRIPGKFNDAKTEEDPSEWKPVISMGSSSPSALGSSEAWHYLSQFHGREAPLLRRPKTNRHSSSSLSTLISATGPLPSLAHTPSTVASSISSCASDISYVPDSSHRPLPPRHNPCFSSSASATKGVELVVPHVETRVKEIYVDPTRGSIFPATSSIWNDHAGEMTPVAATDISVSTNGASSGCGGLRVN